MIINTNTCSTQEIADLLYELSRADRLTVDVIDSEVHHMYAFIPGSNEVMVALQKCHCCCHEQP